ncbi:MAG: phosphoribosyltransferase family protein [Candidatus Omnitrophica bacterium]|nr:phosphoribosyltransferase family protein [Candidatus Omnitrophota bacterium]MDD4013357.1 phosphoribosyltransferase family protein [Candidatus Omnitrophota bacterium]
MRIPGTVPLGGLIHPKDSAQVSVRKDLKGQINGPLISPTFLQERIHDLAVAICRDAKNEKANEIQVVVVLKGAAPFANMLCQEIYRCGGPPVRINYIKASSYAKSLESSGEVKIEGHLPYIRHKDVIIVDDIVDTGLTLAKLKKYFLKERRAASVRICALLDKKARRLPRLRKGLKIDYIGFNIPNMFVAGYGIDCAEKFREIPYVVAVNEGYFGKKKGRK